MIKTILTLCLSICFTYSIGQNKNENNDSWTVKTSGGLVSGVALNSVTVFKGVPYAAPPIGDLRWKAPQPIKKWSRTLACTKFPPSPIQNDPKPFMMWSQEFITPATPLSEDCLYLNIWTPSKKNSKEKLPVFVWIHGGGFVSGSGACPIYDGEAMAKQGIVYVSINYRLGIFGFMAHPDLTAESGKGSSGNYGLMDQVAALQWIKQNIDAFGGDPQRVTIAGQSAGSMSVHALVASPLTRGLFRSAIAESGTMMTRQSPSLQQAEQTGLTLSEKKRTKSIDVLRKLSADSLLALANTLPYGSYFPIVDGYVLPEDVASIFRSKKHNDVTVMAGWVTGDADLALRNVLNAEQFKATAVTNYGVNSEEFLKLFPADNDDVAKVSQRKLATLQFAGFGDHLWASTNVSNTFVYQFSYVPTDKPGFPNYGAFHTSEVPFALHTLKYWDRPWKQLDYDVEKYMSAYWINFIKTGDPNGEGLPQWKKYDAIEQSIMELAEQPSLKKGLYKAEFAFLEKFRK
jgi:para-nitrobenzyl esterase